MPPRAIVPLAAARPIERLRLLLAVLLYAVSMKTQQAAAATLPPGPLKVYGQAKCDERKEQYNRISRGILCGLYGEKGAILMLLLLWLSAFTTAAVIQLALFYTHELITH